MYSEILWSMFHPSINFFFFFLSRHQGFGSLFDNHIRPLKGQRERQKKISKNNRKKIFFHWYLPEHVEYTNMQDYKGVQKSLEQYRRTQDENTYVILNELRVELPKIPTKVKKTMILLLRRFLYFGP